jgi:hypothetical protein
MGYDSDSALVDLELVCCICLEIPLPYLATRTQCLHVYCQQCFAEHTDPQCPYCRHPNPVTLKHPQLQLKLLQLVIRCSAVPELDCGWIGPIKEFAQHARECPLVHLQIEREVEMMAHVKEMLVKYRPNEDMLKRLKVATLKKIIRALQGNVSALGIEKSAFISAILEFTQREVQAYEALKIPNKTKKYVEMESVCMKKSISEIKDELKLYNISVENCFEKKHLVEKLVDYLASLDSFTNDQEEQIDDVHAESKDFSWVLDLSIRQLKMELSKRNALFADCLEKKDLVRKLIECLSQE